MLVCNKCGEMVRDDYDGLFCPEEGCGGVLMPQRIKTPTTGNHSKPQSIVESKETITPPNTMG
jgi:hypothetical protein